jgi:hypothetical protein
MCNLIARLARRQQWSISARLTGRHAPLFLAMLQHYRTQAVEVAMPFYSVSRQPSRNLNGTLLWLSS